MKILFLPENIASMPAITAETLNKDGDIEALCITNNDHKYQTPNKVTIPIYKNFSKNKFINKALLFVWQRTVFAREIKKWIEWADVLHYVWSPALKSGADLRYAHKLNKPIFIEWVGSDIRDPDFLKGINPYYKNAYDNGYEYAAFESSRKAGKRQRLFAANGAIPLVAPEMSLYVKKELFSEVKTVYQRINLKNFHPQYPRIDISKPLIIHSPTAKIAKGSNYIIPVLEELQKEYDFEFKMLHNISRSEVLNLMQQADLFIDQIVGGSYGMATMEAMSFGKPVMCYIMPEVFQAGLPADCPIINTSQENLKQKLIELIKDAQIRHEIGKKSRAFVEEYHDVDKVALQLKEIYTAALKKVS